MLRKILNCACSRCSTTLERQSRIDMELNSEKDKGLDFLDKRIIWASFRATTKIPVNMELFKIWGHDSTDMIN